jgi:hypothetical protein
MLEGRNAMIFGIGVPLTVQNAHSGPLEDLFEAVESLAEALAELEDCKPNLLDSTLSADKSTNIVVVEVSMEANSIGQALDEGLSCIRAGIHATGGATPGWEKSFEDAVAVGEFTSREIISA